MRNGCAAGLEDYNLQLGGWRRTACGLVDADIWVFSKNVISITLSDQGSVS